MELLEDNYNPNIHCKLKEGYDAFGNKLEAPEGYRLFQNDDRVEIGDSYFDIYAGWIINSDKYYIGRTGYYNGGRWTIWAKKIIKTMEREYIKHFVNDMDESMVQHCILCGVIISDYRDAMYPSWQEPPKGFATGNVFVFKGNPTTITTILSEEDKFKNCS